MDLPAGVTCRDGLLECTADLTVLDLATAFEQPGDGHVKLTCWQCRREWFLTPDTAARFHRELDTHRAMRRP
jgi:hypothetical protein